MSLYYIPATFSGDKDYYMYTHVHGPFESREELDKHLSDNYRTHPKATFLMFEGEIVEVPKSPAEKPDHEKRKAGDFKNYTESPVGSKKYVCNTCKQPIMNATVAHPIHLRGMNGGFGECKYEQVPYCPNCEHKPDFHGSPVYV